MSKPRVLTPFNIVTFFIFFGLYWYVAKVQYGNFDELSFSMDIGAKFLAFLIFTLVGTHLLTKISSSQKRINTTFSTILVIYFLYSCWGAVEKKQGYIEDFKTGRQIITQVLDSDVNKSWQEAQNFLVNNSFQEIVIVAGDSEIFKQHRANAENFVALSGKLLEGYNKEPELVAQALEQQSLSYFVEKTLNEQIKNSHENQREIFTKVIHKHQEIGNAFLDLLELLDTSRERWQVQKEQLLFADGEIHKLYNGKADSISLLQEELAQLSEELQKELQKDT